MTKSLAETLAPLIHVVNSRSWVKDDSPVIGAYIGEIITMGELRAICALADQPPQLSDAHCDAIARAILVCNPDNMTIAAWRALIRKAIESTK